MTEPRIFYVRECRPRWHATRMRLALVVGLLVLGPILAVQLDAQVPRTKQGASAEGTYSPIKGDATPAEPEEEEKENERSRRDRGHAPTSDLTGTPEDEAVAQLWQRYAEAPSRINRTDNDSCGNGESFEWTLRWHEHHGGSVKTGELTFPSAVAYGTEANQAVHAAIYKPVASEEDNNEDANDEAPRDQGSQAPAEQATRPAVVLLHHLEDDQRAERIVANYFAMRGYVAALLYFPHYGPRGAEGRPNDREMMRALIGEDFPKVAQAIWDVHRLRDWLRAQPYVDNENISLLGISLGGIVGALSAGIDPGFSRYVFVIAGGDIARVIFNGSNETEWLLEQVRDQGLNEEDLRERVRPVDPCTFAHRIDGSRVLMFNTKEDEVIPRASTEALIDAIEGEPRVHWFPGDHTAVRGRFGQLLTLAHEFVATPVDEQAEAQEKEEEGE